jgi:inosine-uridine nucleoside N-ribohydrolase
MIRRLAFTLLALTLLSGVCDAQQSGAQQSGARRKVIIDQDAFGPAGSNLQAILMLLPWKKITQVPIDPTTRTFFKPEYIRQLAHGHAPFDAYLAEFGQSYPMWDELAVAVWLDPSIVTRSTRLLVDVDTSFTAGYGNTLSWSVGAGPGLGEREVLVVQDVEVPKFERMTLDLLSRATPAH